jgi:hypothetical protein
MSVEFDRGSPGKFDSRTLNRETLNRWTAYAARRVQTPQHTAGGKGLAGIRNTLIITIKPRKFII